MGLKDILYTSYFHYARAKPQRRRAPKTPVEIWRQFWCSCPLKNKSANTVMFFPLPGLSLPGVISWALLGGD